MLLQILQQHFYFPKEYLYADNIPYYDVICNTS